ncbi:hypothetical protein GWK47_025661 [Chionoecetes opilio]|uniref:Uncharacterized protein n=1 Tax=Chionoecetes opilio TaxID=41210 RepID=A0A8J8WD54_CHIOP|nr:hypothetical protein GWK47_025661 [Chionoecetes opilio]
MKRTKANNSLLTEKPSEDQTTNQRLPLKKTRSKSYLPITDAANRLRGSRPAINSTSLRILIMLTSTPEEKTSSYAAEEVNDQEALLPLMNSWNEVLIVLHKRRPGHHSGSTKCASEAALILSWKPQRWKVVAFRSERFVLSSAETLSGLLTCDDVFPSKREFSWTMVQMTVNERVGMVHRRDFSPLPSLLLRHLTFPATSSSAYVPSSPALGLLRPLPFSPPFADPSEALSSLFFMDDKHPYADMSKEVD